LIVHFSYYSQLPQVDVSRGTHSLKMHKMLLLFTSMTRKTFDKNTILPNTFFRCRASIPPRFLPEVSGDDKSPPPDGLKKRFRKNPVDENQREASAERLRLARRR
jgi:hypothetical protein